MLFFFLTSKTALVIIGPLFRKGSPFSGNRMGLELKNSTKEEDMEKVKVLLILALSIVCLGVSSTSAFAAYSSHQNDQDISNFLTVYPFAKSTKLDDCSLCHKGGCIKTNYYGSCDYCHQVYKTQPPHGDILATLNSYGKAYNDAGGTQTALKAIENLNSDGADVLVDCKDPNIKIENNDKSTNIQEIQALTFPGDARDYPGLVPAPAIGMNLERLLKLPSHSEFLFLNASNSRDFYARYQRSQNPGSSEARRNQ